MNLHCLLACCNIFHFHRTQFLLINVPYLSLHTSFRHYHSLRSFSYTNIYTRQQKKEGENNTCERSKARFFLIWFISTVVFLDKLTRMRMKINGRQHHLITRGGEEECNKKHKTELDTLAEFSKECQKYFKHLFFIVIYFLRI